MSIKITKERFTEEEWQSLLYAPLMIFNIVAGADGRIDQKEAQEFKNLLVEGLLSDIELMKLVMNELLQDLEGLTSKVFSGEMDPNDCMESIRRAVDVELNEEEALAFKLALLTIGKKIAQASGGFLGMGSKICLSEKQAMARLAAALHVIEIPDS
ncbi:hypothetical protein A9Q99_27180 [Gammaproteobacteria bacterium 45_16_T64]|nr:hypothetical protein A9Q99_27180 [Gammaproteobacteria bacterium 45_16_T64]